jgi:hypothetical protein
LRTAASKTVSGISTEQSGGERPLSAARLEKQTRLSAEPLFDPQDFPLWTFFPHAPGKSFPPCWVG